MEIYFEITTIKVQSNASFVYIIISCNPHNNPSMDPYIPHEKGEPQVGDSLAQNDNIQVHA